MPLLTIASAVCLTTVSFKPSQWNLFQLFQPIGGLSAKPLLSSADFAARSSGSSPPADPAGLVALVLWAAQPENAKAVRAHARQLRFRLVI